MLEHTSLIEDRWGLRHRICETEDLAVCSCVLRLVVRAEGIVLEVCAEFSNCAEQDGVVEVEIQYARMVGSIAGWDPRCHSSDSSNRGRCG